MARLTLLLALSLALLAPATSAAAATPPVRHVFLIVLENKDFETTFGTATKAPYLAHTLRARGSLLTQYFGTSHASLGNYVSMVSGQAANPLTQADCPFWLDIIPGTSTANGQTFGLGCVYPRRVETIANQLEAAKLRWRGYMEDMGTPCRHPAIGSFDHTESARVGDQYAARHNPFVYFHSIIDSPTCAANDVPLTRLPADLRSIGTTPNYAFITPNLCNDGHDEPCVDNAPGGLRSADAFLRRWVPQILASPAYQADGLLIVTFDEADESNAACCGEQTGPSTPRPGIGGPGGGRIGAVAISPWIRPGSTTAVPYNHYSLLRSVEDLFALGHLGFAAPAALRAFGADLYNGHPAIRPLGSRRIRRCSAGGGRPLRSLRLGRPGEDGTALALSVRRRSRVQIALRGGGPRLTSTLTARPCRTYRFALPAATGRVTVRLRAGRTRQAATRSIGP